MAKYKTTGCFKFLIFLLIAIPVAFVISSYYHDENPLDFIKDKLGNETTVNSTNSSEYSSDCELQVNDLRNQIRDLNIENENLSNLLNEKEKEIKRLESGI